MQLSAFFIRRPVFTTVFILVFVIIGALSLKNLPIRHLPQVNQAVISIVTDYEGASPELIEKEVTVPIENAVSGINGLDMMSSNSRLGKSYVRLDFKLGIDPTEAANDIRNKMSALQRRLPEGCDSPAVRKSDDEADPIVIIGFEDSKKNALEITDFLSRYIKPAFEEIPGAGEVLTYGARNYAVKIALDPIKTAAYKISVADISRALKQQNIDIPSGQIESKNRVYTVVAKAKLDDAMHFGNLVLSNKNDHIIRLADVAKIQVSNENESTLLRINGQSAVGLAILPQSTANPLALADRVHQTLKQLQKDFPASMKASIVFDASLYIKQSIIEVMKTFIEAMIFVSLVIFLFLGNLRAAIIPIITIPICLIASFWPMQYFGFDLNILTLLALVLAIGLVVDDAIVVIENCHRHMQQGKTAMQAAIDGSREISFAVIAMTITLAAVYAPMGFVEGFTGRLFLQFGVTLSIAVILSGIVALSLTPMMCARLKAQTNSRYTAFLDKLFEKLSVYYQKSLTFLLHHKFLFSAMLIGFAALSFHAYQRINAELAPSEDQSYIVVPFSSPTNASTAYTDNYARQLENLYAHIPEMKNYLMYVKPTGGYSLINLQTWDKRKRSQQEISANLSQNIQQIVGINAYPVPANPLGRSQGNSHLQLALLSNTSYQRLDSISHEIAQALKAVPEFKQVRSNLTLDSEQINLSIDRKRAADLQVNLADIAELLSTMLGGESPISFNFQGQSYPVIVELDQRLKKDASIINKLYVESARKQMIPLSSLITSKREVGPETMPHLNRLRTASISAEMRPNAPMDQAIRDVEAILKQKLPEDIHYRFTDAARDYMESSGSSQFAFILAMLFIYLVLAAQFESFRDPFIVLSAVPFSLSAALLSLWAFQGSLNIYTNIGMITLIGLISKHGIMMTEFANQLKTAGSPKKEAILKSASIRLRPILMTSLAMILGALPLIFASGAGSESRMQLGLVMIGGLSFGTLLALFIVPAVYLVLAKDP